ncbi:MAG: B12-binding domain-containing radical SAM protein [Promethearchaeota archaeon]
MLELFHYPLGLLSVASKVKEEGFHVSIIDEVLLRKSRKSLEDFLSKVSIVGISGCITQHNIIIQIAKRIKDFNSTIKVVFGGPHITLSKDLMIKESNVDYLIQGEGELAFTELINSLDNNRPVRDIDGLIFRENGKIKINPPKIIEDLDKLPIPAFELSKLDVYCELFFKKYDQLKSLLFPRSYRIPLESSRGCPVACNFCCAKIILGTKWRGKSPERLIQEMGRIEELFPKIFHAEETYLTYVDNNFTTSKKRVNKFCELKKKSKFDINWAGLSRATDLNYELLKTMVDVGFIGTYIGGESGNIASLASMGKKYKQDSTITAVKACIKVNVQRIIVSFIIGLPYEDLASIKNTLKYAYKIRELAPEKVIIAVYKATPYPSTAFWDEMEQQGRLSPDFEKYDLSLRKGLVFDHPIFGYNAVQIDNIINLWNKLTALKYFKNEFIKKRISHLKFSKFINNFLKELKSMGIDHIPESLVLKSSSESQTLELCDKLITTLEQLVLN